MSSIWAKHVLCAILLLISSGSGQLHFRQRRPRVLWHISCFCTRDNPVVFSPFRGYALSANTSALVLLGSRRGSSILESCTSAMSLHSREWSCASRPPRHGLIAKECLIVLLRPRASTSFWRSFSGASPILRRTAVLDLVILFPRIPLARCLDKTCIYYLALLRGISRSFNWRPNRSNSFLTTPACVSVSRNNQTVFSSGMLSSEVSPRNRLNVNRSSIWNWVCASERPYIVCNTRILNIRT